MLKLDDAGLTAFFERAKRDDACERIVPSDLRQLIAEIQRQRSLFKKVQEHCAGDAAPRWGRDPATANSRCYLLDICNAALD